MTAVLRRAACRPLLVTKHAALPQNLDGVVMPLFKPSGVRSNTFLEKVTCLFGLKQGVGFTGVLDERASGLLLLCFGRATKLFDSLNEVSKTYEFSLRLGQRTPTGDTGSAVCEEQSWSHITTDSVRAALGHFTGDLQQRVPVYSNAKFNGERLSDLARAGVEVLEDMRPLKAHHVFRLELLKQSDATLCFQVEATSGFYVRQLCEDLARELGTVGHASAIHRQKIGDIDLQMAWTLEELEEFVTATPGEFSIQQSVKRNDIEGSPTPRRRRQKAPVLGPKGQRWQLRKRTP